MEYGKLVENAVGKWAQDNALDVPRETLQKLVYALTSSSIPHSPKEARKAAQKYSREARRVIGGYQQELKGKLAHLNDVLRKKPKWVPSRVWRICANWFIDISRVEMPLS